MPDLKASVGDTVLRMRDAGLDRAIEAAGGVVSLARAVGISQPSISAWSRIPADRVLSIESLTRVPRDVLRPDLYGPAESGAAAADAVDQLRAAEYDLLSLLLGKAPNADTLSRLTTLKGDASDLGMAHIELAVVAADCDERAVSKEFFNLFVGLGRGELLPYASYYLTGFLHERPLGRVREDFDLLGIERAGVSREPEDHIAILLEVMAGLARGDFGADVAMQARFFERHLKPWAARMFVDLETSSTARFYRAVGAVGRVFMELESEAFTLSE